MAPQHAGTEPAADELTFRWRGGRPSLNFTATLGQRWGDTIERLRKPSDLQRWFREAGLTDHAVTVTAARLVQAREVREALYRLCTAVRLGRVPAAGDVARVNRWAVRPVRGGSLLLADDGFRLRAPDLAAADLLAVVSADGVGLLAGSLASRIKECARDDCALLFLDESRGGARRWCSMDDCGARSKMSAYRRRLAGE